MPGSASRASAAAFPADLAVFRVVILGHIVEPVVSEAHHRRLNGQSITAPLLIGS